MNLMYHSTRSRSNKVTASQAILQGLSKDGGLYVPDSLPKLDKTIEELSKLSYQELAYEVMKMFFTDFTEDELKLCISKAYDDKFDTKEIAPTVKVGDNYYLELFHGETIAFKDMALSILPHLLITAANKNKIEDEIVILTATSGDTGKAALAGFADVKSTKIIVFYPKNGVSSVQEKQMVTQKGDNTFVIGIEGNFDDAQTGVKEIFNNNDLASKLKEAGYILSSANSINIGRLVPQIVYYIYSYVSLFKSGEIKLGDKINYVVPTGNFGNILAGYYAKSMGLPINKLICASNENKVLYDFFKTGKYDKDRDFVLTSSPSMDILVSSNLERLLYSIGDQEEEGTLDLMNSLNNKGYYEISKDMLSKLDDFYGGWANNSETCKTISEVYKETGYVLDTHTGVAANVYDKYINETKDDTKTIIVSTASPYKFGDNVLKAIYEGEIPSDDYQQAKLLEELSKVNIPLAVAELESAEVRHNAICDKSEMEKSIKNILKIV
ncbi:MAG TPA: threonine synthase [Clostridiales bacterium]|nr:threonine synthase [Clostridiales bacterium]